MLSPDQQSTTKSLLTYASNSRYRLVLIVGEARSGKTTLLKSIAARWPMTIFAASEWLGKRLSEKSPRQRPLAIESLLNELITPSQGAAGVDNTDILFEPSLSCDPLRLACSLSQNTLVILALEGRLEGRRFVRGYPDHPEFYSQEVPSVPIIQVSRGELTFHTF